MKEDVYIISAVRTAIGRYGGSLRTVTSGELGAIVIKESLQRAGILPEQVDEVIMGEVRQSTESANMARVASLRAGLPEEVPAFTVNRLCASGMEAMYSGYLRIAAGEADVIIVGGAENMSRAPYYLRNARWGDGPVQLIDSNLEGGPGAQPNEIYGSDLSMGMTAENVAEKFNVSREDQDKFATRSHRLTSRAINEGKFKEEIVPVEVKTRKKTFIFDTDEHVRPETTEEILAKLQPAFKPGGSVTAGNSCGRNDGAAAMVLASGRAVQELGLTPMGKILGFSVAGVSPRYMGIGPVPAVRKLLGKLNLKLSDIDLIELNEAFAAQALACIRELGLDLDRVNVNGSGIAMGHPLGATGCRIAVTLLYEMKRRNARLGMATLCVGGGQGMAVVIENV
ncbi:acetyl-CoA acetyltransferase [Desulfofundulus kuznetsovii DSM 6115]|uniref:Acetyl-CoA acetyltransferase n=1 Tax=Desulfofundulus kuznetsovii (strain DSM 6115 / VKM B-1805 / 17) TaxID=760568 RepID=A0AAU8Q0C0_DESK7|nr:acetyl-CoA acetyltransferase [Desulfofundulus kuznetsovii DSM 6115]